MAHHGDKTEELRKFFGKFFDLQESLGATDRFPDGKLTDDDEGEIDIAVFAIPEEQKVIIDFGKPVAWIGFTPELALQIAKSLIDKSRVCSEIKYKEHEHLQWP